jgi:4-hydroxybenzoyl-CoA thioesterase
MLVNMRPLRIEWGDCDPAGIVYYPRYFVFFDNCTAALFEAALGVTKHEWVRRYDIVGIPMVKTGGDFHIPSKYGDDLMVETTITDLRRSSFDVRHRMMKGDALAVEGVETRVWVGRHPDDPTRIKSQPIPAEVVARLSAG